jgi:hypothetical protein
MPKSAAAALRWINHPSGARRGAPDAVNLAADSHTGRAAAA